MADDQTTEEDDEIGADSPCIGAAPCDPEAVAPVPWRARAFVAKAEEAICKALAMRPSAPASFALQVCQAQVSLREAQIELEIAARTTRPVTVFEHMRRLNSAEKYFLAEKDGWRPIDLPTGPWLHRATGLKCDTVNDAVAYILMQKRRHEQDRPVNPEKPETTLSGIEDVVDGIAKRRKSKR